MSKAPNKIKILYIITQLELGGAQLNTLELIKTLDKHKFEAALICADIGYLVEEIKNNPPCKVYFLPTLKRNIDPISDLRTFVSLVQRIRNEKPDIVHTHSSKAGILGRWAAKCSGVKTIIHTIHGFPFYDYQNKLIKCFYIWLERITAKITTKFIAVSQYDVNKGVKYKIGLPENYVIIPCAINPDKFITTGNTCLRIKSELGIKNGAKIVGMVACFKPQKAPLDFIEVCSIVSRQFPDTKFILVGDGVLRKKIEQRIRKHRLENRIIMTGWRRDIPDILSILDVFVLTSYWEGLPITIIEAMYMGVPVVANNVGGVNELVKDMATGYLISPGKVGEMSQRIFELLNNTAKRADMSKSAKEAVKSDYYLATMAKNTEHFYEDLSSNICGRI